MSSPTASALHVALLVLFQIFMVFFWEIFLPSHRNIIGISKTSGAFPNLHLKPRRRCGRGESQVFSGQRRCAKIESVLKTVAFNGDGDFLSCNSNTAFSA